MRLCLIMLASLILNGTFSSGVAATCGRDFAQTLFKPSAPRHRTDVFLRHHVLNSEWFHPDKAIRKKAYRLFSESQPIRLHLIEDLETIRIEDTRKAIDALQMLPPTERKSLLTSKEAWEDWLQKEISETDVPFVNLNGKRINQTNYDSLFELQKQLKEQGFETEVAVSRNRKINHPQGDGVLVVKSFRKKEGNIPEKITPGSIIFDHPLFQDYVDKMSKEGGMIVFDRHILDTRVRGVFGIGSGIDGANYIISVKPETNWSTWLHEWQHKSDIIDSEGNLAGDIRNQARPKGKAVSKFRRKMYRKGAELEFDSSTELSATERQFRLFLETRKLPLKEAYFTLTYRGYHQVKLGIGRMMMDPLHPKHLILALRGVGNLIIPTYSLNSAIHLIGLGIIRSIRSVEAQAKKETINSEP